MLLRNSWAIFAPFLLLSIIFPGNAQDFGLPCDHPVYCYGCILETVQLSNLFSDSKDFVDSPLLVNPEDAIADFENLNFTFCGNVSADPEKMDDLWDFYLRNFDFPNSTDLVNLTLTDWVPNPVFLDGIVDPNLKEFGDHLHALWNKLGRKVPESADGSNRTSLVYVSNPVVVPGGRFREFFYWDSYWIQKGLLVSGMVNTTKGMIENFFEMVNDDRFGFVPNGGRIYFNRSQPALLTPMVWNYYMETMDDDFIQTSLPTLEKEFEFWMRERMVTFQKNGKEYRMAAYHVNKTHPRPESYDKDFKVVDPLRVSNETKELIYSHIKGACESGWDFSSRWYKYDFNDGHVGSNISHTRTRDIIPVDLNSILFWSADILGRFCGWWDSCNKTREYYHDIAQQFKTGIKDVFWHESDGIWYDWDYVDQLPRRAFYPTNISPLWVKAHHEDDDPTVVSKIMSYIRSSAVLQYEGGVPTSLVIQSGQQWDFPAAWPPLVHIFIEALANSGNQDAVSVSLNLTQKWVTSNYLGWKVDGGMWEKYDCQRPGCPGGGGYYEVVDGFGWTNGVILDFLKKHGDTLVAPQDVPDDLNCEATIIRRK